MNEALNNLLQKVKDLRNIQEQMIRHLEDVQKGFEEVVDHYGTNEMWCPTCQVLISDKHECYECKFCGTKL